MSERKQYLMWLALALVWTWFAMTEMSEPMHAITDCGVAAGFTLAFIVRYFSERSL